MLGCLQDELDDDDIMILDNGEQVFLWMGPRCSEVEVKLAYKSAQVLEGLIGLMGRGGGVPAEGRNCGALYSKLQTCFCFSVSCSW